MKEFKISIPTVNVSLYRDYKAGKLTLKECARQFCKHGWTNFVDTAYTEREFARLEKDGNY